MLLRAPILLAAALLALGACSRQPDEDVGTPAKAVPAVPAPAGRSWSDVVALTPDGGVRMGNPNAQVQLVEYGSFTCPHCARFDAEGVPLLKRDYVGTGKMSYEMRPFLIHSPDTAISLLVLCRGPETFFPIADQVFATQDTWLNKLIAVPAKVQESWQTMAPVDQFQAIARYSGLKSFLAARGLAPARADACLADAHAATKLVQMRDHGTNDLGVNGTPAFFINGQQQQEVFGWAQLEPKLKAAVGG